MSTSGSVRRAALVEMKRACYAGLDSVALRAELARRLQRAVPLAAYSSSTTDPDTGLLSHMVGEGIPDRLARGYVERAYPLEEAQLNVDAARAGRTVISVAERSDSFRRLLHENGFEHEANALAVADGALWGTFCMLREVGSTAFSRPDLDLLARAAPHIARGLRSAALLEIARSRDAEDAAALDPGRPGLLVLDAHGRIERRNAVAADHLRDLGEPDDPPEVLPYAIVCATLHLRHLQRSALDPETPTEATLRARGRSGRWYALRASTSEPDATGASATFVVTEPLGTRDLAPILGQLYGLTPRERQVLTHVLRGESTKRIAARLRLSAHTVQDHLDHACEKVGVRGRKALLAKLFTDGLAARL